MNNSENSDEYEPIVGNPPVVNITGGTVIGNEGYAITGYIRNDLITSGRFIYTGGTLKAKKSETVIYSYMVGVVEKNYKDEYTTVIGGYYETVIVSDVASIGETTYDSLEDALSAVKDNETIVLNTNVTVHTINISKSITINLNGKILNSFVSEMSTNLLNIEVYNFITVEDDVEFTVYGGKIESWHLGSTAINSSGILNVGLSNGSLDSDNPLIQSNGYGVVITNKSVFNFNNGSLMAMESAYICSIRDMYVREGHYLEYNIIDEYNFVGLVEGDLLDDDLIVEAVAEKVDDTWMVNIKISQNGFVPSESYASMYLSLLANEGEGYLQRIGCEVGESFTVCSIEASKLLSYLNNVEYEDELIVEYNEDGYMDFVRTNFKIIRVNDVNISFDEIEGVEDLIGDNNGLLTDGEIILINLANYQGVVNLNENEDIKEAVAKALLGEHLNLLVSEIILDEIDIDYACQDKWVGDGYTNTCLVDIGIASITMTSSSVPIPVNNSKLRVLIYDYTPKVLDSDGNVSQESKVTVCELGDECEVSELSFTNHLGNKVNNVETVITLNGEVVNSINTSVLGNYLVTSVTTDEYGNSSRAVVREYRVVDTIAPTVIANDIVIKKGDVYNDSDIIVNDNYDNNVIIERISENVDFKKAGIYKVEYKATDSSGNVTNFYRIVTVENDYSFIWYIISLLSVIASAIFIILIKKRKYSN